jgi:hypothetical protein
VAGSVPTTVHAPPRAAWRLPCTCTSRVLLPLVLKASIKAAMKTCAPASSVAWVC